MEPKKPQKNNYNLKSDAVETLAGTDREPVPEYSQEELDRYRSRKKVKMSQTVKAVLLKTWFAGAVCYFILWGLGTYVAGLDMLVILAVALGMVTDLLTNNVIRFFEDVPGGNDRYLMVRRRGVPGFFLNILYAAVLLLCVYTTYNLINLAIVAVTGATDTVPLGVEPILFGLLTMGFDLLFLGARRMAVSMVRDAMASAAGQPRDNENP